MKRETFTTRVRQHPVTALLLSAGIVLELVVLYLILKRAL